MEKRGINLIGGIVIVLIFWLVCSMPTNTHTFFYRNLIDQKVTTDIASTQAYLSQIKEGTTTEAKIQERINESNNKINLKLKELESEIMSDMNPGFGPKSKEIFRDFATLLDVAKVEPLNVKASSKAERQKLCDQYRQKIYALRDIRNESIRNSMTPASGNQKQQAEKNFKALDLIRKNIQNGTLDLNEADDISMICNQLNQGYSTIKTYNQFVEFKNPEDKAAYTAGDPETKVTRMLSVYDVWHDFLTGKLGGLGFVFWIIISILVDIAAFIFFDIAFKKRD